MTTTTMMDVPSLEKIDRKELQALAKEHGIRANQKSAILRHELRAVLQRVLQNIADEAAQDENADAERSTLLAEESNRNGEQVNLDYNGSMLGAAAAAAASGIMQVEEDTSTSAEESPTTTIGSSEITTDDGIELYCSPDKEASEENVHNERIVQANGENVADVTAEHVLTGINNSAEVNVDDRSHSRAEVGEERATGSIVQVEDTAPMEESSSTSSEMANITAHNTIELSLPAPNASQENVHSDIIHNANDENVPHATADSMLANSEEMRADKHELTDCSPTKPREKRMYNDIIIHANEEHSVNVIAESTAAADNPGSDDNEEVNGCEREIPDRSPIEPGEEHATSAMQPEDTLAEEESPTGSDMANITADDRIELSSPNPTSEENVQNGTIINANEENVPDATAEDILLARDSVEVNVDQDCPPTTEQNEEHATSIVHVEDTLAEESPSTSSKMANVSDADSIELSSPDKASEENAHNDIIINVDEENVADATAENMLPEKPGSESGEVNVDERKMEDCSPPEPREEPASDAVQVEDDTPSEESRTTSEKTNASDDRIEVSSPGEVSEENVNNNSVMCERNMSGSEAAVRNIEEVNIDGQETENPVNEEEMDGYSEILQSEHQPNEKPSDDAAHSPSVVVAVFRDESASTLTIDSFTRTENTENALVDKAGTEAEDESSKKTSETLVEKEVAADEVSEEGRSADGGSANDTNYSQTAARGQHEHSHVGKKINSSAPVCKMASRECRKRPLSKGEQMSFGYIRKKLHSLSTTTSSQASTHKGDAKKAKSLPPACQSLAQDLRNRPTSSGNKKVLAVKGRKPRVPLQTLSNQKDKPKPFPANTKRPIHASMSERNEKQFKKFLHRQAAAREKRATEAVPAEFHRN